MRCGRTGPSRVSTPSSERSRCWKGRPMPLAEPFPGDVGWPYGVLDFETLVDGGWRPIPFRQFIVKLHGQCNLACPYCYVYQKTDQSWATRPRRMASATLAQT